MYDLSSIVTINFLPSRPAL